MNSRCPNCVNGYVILLTSRNKCVNCNGTGYLSPGNMFGNLMLDGHSIYIDGDFYGGATDIRFECVSERPTDMSSFVYVVEGSLEVATMIGPGRVVIKGQLNPQR